MRGWIIAICLSIPHCWLATVGLLTVPDRIRKTLTRLLLQLKTDLSDRVGAFSYMEVPVSQARVRGHKHIRRNKYINGFQAYLNMRVA
jgi:hypothetical protein